MADRGALVFLGAGAALLALTFACGGGEASEDRRGKAAARPGDGDVALAAPQGRSFLDAGPAEGELVVTTAEARFASGELDMDAVRSGGGRPSAISDLARSVDPSMLTPEALANNPLVIGTEKREPFVLPEGADPFDPTVYGWEKDEDGHWIIAWSDLSLEGVDKDLLLDALVYPEEYEDEEVPFPDRIKALDGERIALTGYMIAVTWNDDRVKNFMLVRDLMACCFGGSPEPDEWVDVTMEGKGSPYIQFVPVVTRGTFHIQGLSDAAGYATGAFRLEGVDTREE